MRAESISVILLLFILPMMCLAQDGSRMSYSARMPDECLYPDLQDSEQRIKYKRVMAGAFSKPAEFLIDGLSAENLRIYDSNDYKEFEKLLAYDSELGVGLWLDKKYRVLLLAYKSKEMGNIQITDSVKSSQNDESKIRIKYAVLPEKDAFKSDKVTIGYSAVVLPESKNPVEAVEAPAPYYVLKNSQKSSLSAKKRELNKESAGFHLAWSGLRPIVLLKSREQFGAQMRKNGILCLKELAQELASSAQVLRQQIVCSCFCRQLQYCRYCCASNRCSER